MNSEHPSEKTESRLFEDPESFISDFFQSLEGQTTVTASTYFKLFREPPNFQSLVKGFSESSYPRVVLLDGQSRAGKTWTGLGLIKRLLEKGLVDGVWSAGEDSSSVFTQGRKTVEDGINWVAQSLTSLWNRKPPTPGYRLIIFLDDFFGSAWLRPLTSDEKARELVRNVLTIGDDRNPLLQALRSVANVQATLVMTGRSSIFSLAETRLGAWLGDRFARNEQAFFQHLTGELIGEGTAEWLDSCLKAHKNFSAEHPEFELPPLTAFTATCLDEDEEHAMPQIFFGGDLRAILEELSREEEATKAYHGFLLADSTTRVRRLLLTYVAPALVLPLPWIDACIVDEQSRSTVRSLLSLQPESHGDFALRVPNRYYLRAIQEELLDPDSLELLTDSLIAHADSGLSSECNLHLPILSRGVIERGLESVIEIREIDKQGGAKLRERLANRVADLPGAQEEPLLKWETALIRGSLDSNEITEVIETVPLRRGLASAIGWGLYRFGTIPLAAEDSKSAAITRICSAFQLRANNVDNDQREALIVSYSNFIRWAAQMDPAPTEGSPIDKLSKIVESIDSDLTKDKMQMVLEDALIWADSYQVKKDVPIVSVDRLPAVRQLWHSLEFDTLDKTDLELDDSCLVNRLFSLEWHNEWKERSSGYKKEVLHHWLQKNSQRGLDLIGSKPTLLDDNLNYHWSHMITQWSVWARDWCFAQDPNQHEYQKELIGCADQKNNHGIHLILGEAINSALKNNEKNRFRNAFFLLAIRLTGLPDDSLKAMHTYLSEKVQEASRASAAIRSDLAHAIYELIRQGYIDSTKFPVPPEPIDESKHQLPRELCVQCLEFVYRPKGNESEDWSTYLDELKTITCLDALPQNLNDLIPYLET